MIERNTELESEFEELKAELKIFETLKVGDKISRDGATNILYIDPPSTFQMLWRWWNSENRLKTVGHLDNYFKKFMKFLDKILGVIRMRGFNIQIKILTKKISEFINLIIVGLNNLKFTYPTTPEIHAKLGSIILTLIDFKEEIQRLRPKSRGSKGLVRSASFEM